MSELLDLIAGILNLPDGSNHRRKRVFSPGFLIFAACVAFVELVLLNAWYGSGA
ncbi:MULTISPECIES: hypothetical protein [Pseudomonas]|uniref:Uncharacterized protein n=1 Tax=Pseudomonas asplenii TaxID=53407 RepID=A0A0N0VIJ3_9PSED|nr:MULTISPECIES: hypothetical protein [Pseudomonas]KPA87662.1 hypothetical protein PF66_05882 [Pseudomonas fuscovaginae]KPA99126.1 hypothetical protein PF70_00729 [Pseudomonas fuscovaginae]